MRYYIEKIGTWNFLVYLCARYPSARGYLMDMFSELTSAEGSFDDALGRLVEGVWGRLRDNDWSLEKALGPTEG